MLAIGLIEKACLGMPDTGNDYGEGSSHMWAQLLLNGRGPFYKIIFGPKSHGVAFMPSWSLQFTWRNYRLPESPISSIFTWYTFRSRPFLYPSRMAAICLTHVVACKVWRVTCFCLSSSPFLASLWWIEVATTWACRILDYIMAFCYYRRAADKPSKIAAPRLPLLSVSNIAVEKTRCSVSVSKKRNAMSGESQ